MPNRHNVPDYQGMLDRPRVHALIDQGLEHPLLVVLAGPGYGKTQSIASYLTQTKAKILWLHLNRVDNLQSHFWVRLMQAVERAFPELSEDLQTFEFPTTPSQLDAFLQILLKGFARHDRVIWVLDDFGEITDPGIKDFLRILAEMELDALRLILISSAITHMESAAFISSKRALLLGKDLRFTREEISALYAQYGIPLEKDELTDIERYTEGWPLPLHLLVLYRGEAEQYERRLTPQAVSHMFEERFFSAYPQPIQALLVKLSLLDSFTWDLAADLYTGDRTDLKAFSDHAFIKNEPNLGQFFFHQLYRLFLQEKQYLLRENEVRALWRKAARRYQALGHTIEAIAGYRKCEDYVGMLGVISDYPRTQHGITGANAAYFLEHLDLLTPAQVRAHPVADYLRALIYLNTLQLDNAETLLNDLERRMLSKNTHEALALLGDAYAMMGAIHMMRNQEDFGDYYQKAAGYLPNGTNFKSKNKLVNRNNSNFSMADNLPGAKERMEKAVHYGVPWINKVLDGGLAGMEHLFSAEAAYLSGQWGEAKQHAYRAIYKAEGQAQHDLVCNSHLILARTGLLQGSFVELSGQIQKIVEYADKYSIGTLKEIRDTALAWYYIKMRDHSKIPRSILQMNSAEWPVISIGRAQIVYANHLIDIGEYAKLIGLLEGSGGLFLSGGIWLDRICLYVLLAIAYHYVGKPDAAMNALWTAYDMCYANGLTTPFVEGENHMRILVDLARRQQKYAFNGQWLDMISKEAVANAKRAAVVRSTYAKQNPETTAIDNPLTRREREILSALAQGLTREEIAGQQYISINTVKTFIRSIYNKLSAFNRAEAISIAISRGYLDVRAPD